MNIKDRHDKPERPKTPVARQPGTWIGVATVLISAAALSLQAKALNNSQIETKKKEMELLLADTNLQTVTENLKDKKEELKNKNEELKNKKEELEKVRSRRALAERELNSLQESVDRLEGKIDDLAKPPKIHFKPHSITDPGGDGYTKFTYTLEVDYYQCVGVTSIRVREIINKQFNQLITLQKIGTHKFSAVVNARIVNSPEATYRISFLNVTKDIGNNTGVKDDFWIK